MYFPSYEEALRAALKQSKEKLEDCKLYVKAVYYADYPTQQFGERYKIGFTPDDKEDAYIYNGQVIQQQTEGN